MARLIPLLLVSSFPYCEQINIRVCTHLLYLLINDYRINIMKIVILIIFCQNACTRVYMTREPGNRVLFSLPFGLDLEVNTNDRTYLFTS